jgi:hypothetical protein
MKNKTLEKAISVGLAGLTVVSTTPIPTVAESNVNEYTQEGTQKIVTILM